MYFTRGVCKTVGSTTYSQPFNTTYYIQNSEGYSMHFNFTKNEVVDDQSRMYPLRAK